MIFSKRSALHIFIIAASLLGILLGMPSVTKAAEAGPDWMDGVITAINKGEQEWSDADQAIYNNIPCENITANTWRWHDNGLTRWKVEVLQNNCVTAGETAYLGWREVLPFGSKYWQLYDLSNYYHPWLFPNHGTNGMALITNAYVEYANNMPSELYYTSDVLATFDSLSVDSTGNIVRSQAKAFEYKLTYPDGRTFVVNDIGSISYSANGKWMHVNRPDVAQLRIDTDNFSVLSFAPGTNNQYATYTSMTNSGNTVATYSYGPGLKIYDLTNCESEKPDYGSRNCKVRDITQIAQDSFRIISSDTPVNILGIKFQTESRLRLFLQYRRGIDIKEGFVDVEITTGQQPMRYLALGDSFSSGEGIFTYRQETNFYHSSSDYNLCHTSTWSYPYIVSANVKPTSMNSIACSGAKSWQIYNNATDDIFMQRISEQKQQNLSLGVVKDQLLPGYIAQSSLVNHTSPNVITLSIGGNDIGFGNIISACITQAGCFSNRDEREAKADEIAQKIPQWTRTFMDIKDKMDWRQQRLYVVGYPKITNDTNTNCSLIGQGERQRLNALADYLNEAIRVAAGRAGAQYVDVSDVFYGSEANSDRRLCGDGPLAVNGFLPNFYADQQKSAYPPGDIFAHESYHPNFIGHVLLAQRIMMSTNNLQLEATALPTTGSRPSSIAYEAFVGDDTDLIHGVYDAIGTAFSIVVRGATTVVDLTTNVVASVQGTLTLHSDPLNLGTFTTDSTGHLLENVEIPGSVSPGFHRLEFSYSAPDGELHTTYQYIFVVASLEDYDGDGVLNSREQCVVGGILGIDQNNNGIDDACDNQAIKPNLTMEEVQEVVASGSVSADAYKKLINTVITDVDLPTDLSITNSKVQQNNVASLSPNLSKISTQSMTHRNVSTLYLVSMALGAIVIIMLSIWILRRKKA